MKIKNGLVAEEVLRAWQYFCWFGALGAKSRNGFGGFTVKSVEGDLAGEQREALMTFPGAGSLAAYKKYKGLPGFSAFCWEARLFKTRQNWPAALERLSLMAQWAL